MDTDCIDQRKFLNLLDTSNLAQNVNKATHLHGHTLDLILSPSDSSFVSNVTVGEMVSDHALVKCHLDFAFPAVPKVDSISYRRYHKINMKSFCEDLANTSFVTSPATEAADLYDQYIRDLGGVLDRHAPLICRRAKKTPAGWLSDSYRRAKSIRRQFERMWRRDRSQLSRSRLRRQIARCNAIINRDKAEYYSTIISDNSRDPKKLWHTLRQVLNSGQESTLPPHQSEKSLANKFASFFHKKIKRIRDMFTASSATVISPMCTPPNLPSFNEVSEDEVLKIIKNSPTKSCLLDPVPTFLLKDCVEILLPSITKLVNLSLDEGVFPQKFKKAVVTPLIKKASLPNEDLQNYRPVSGLCFMSKLVERVVVKQLMQHINSNNLDNPRQSACKSGHSTETALLLIKNEIHLSLSRGEPTALVLLDLSAAFDTIDQPTLRNCLKSWFGVSGTALKWFTSYLSHRFQAIKIGSTLSDLHELLFGVPQGSVLGPLLFSLYTTPLSKVIGTHPDIKYHFYADDTQLFIHISHKNAALAFNKLNSCLLDVQKWMSSSMLKLNPDKTEFIIFGSHAQLKKLDPYLPVKIFGNFMHPAVVVKNLGVWFDANFSFANHVRNICKTCFIQIRDLRRVRKHLTDEAAILASNALVSSRLDYCNSLFRSLSSLNMRKLQCIQNTLARIVTNCNKYTRASPILKRLHWLPVESRCIFKTATLVYKFLHSGHPSYFGPLLPTRCGRYSTRYNHPDKRFLEVPQFCPSVHKSKNHFGHSFAFDAPTVWNHLPNEVRSAPTLTCFRKRLKSYLFHKAFPP